MHNGEMRRLLPIFPLPPSRMERVVDVKKNVTNEGFFLLHIRIFLHIDSPNHLPLARASSPSPFVALLPDRSCEEAATPAKKNACY